MALFDLYAEYINTESNRILEPYEVRNVRFTKVNTYFTTKIQKIERPVGTVVKNGNNQDSSYDEASYFQDLDLHLDPPLATLVSHETISRVWQFESRQATQLRRCLSKPSVMENIYDLTNCRLVLAETGAVTVKGDNDQDLNKAMDELDKLGKALVSPRHLSVFVRLTFRVYP